jgi:hypothetical protein
VSEHVEESTQERSRRQMMELLQELRVALPGVQVLFAFLLTVPFTQGWSRATSFQQDLYAFFIAPSAIHRLDFEQGDKPEIVAISNVLTIVGLTFLALAVVGVVLLISDILYGGAAVIGFTVGIAAVFVVLWYGIGLYLRLRH